MPTMTTSTPTQTAPLWTSNGGNVSCAHHGGYALQAAVEAHPKRRTHVTSLDVWMAVDDADLLAWPTDDLGPMVCESVDRGACA